MSVLHKKILSEMDAVRDALHKKKFTVEVQVSQGIVLRLLAAAGWPIFEPWIVRPEFWPHVRSARVDFALEHPKQPGLVYIEVKSVGKLAEGYAQLRDYVFEAKPPVPQGVPFGVVTDGKTWDFFCFPSGAAGEAPEHPFRRIDLLEDAPAESASQFAQLLGYPALGDGSAVRLAHAAQGERAAGAVSVTQASARSGSRRANVNAQLSFTLDGKTTTRGTNEDVMAAVIEAFVRRDETFFDRFRLEHRDSHGNPFAAPTREELWPARADRKLSRSIPLEGGGYIKKLTRPSMAREVIRKACQTAGVQYGSELKVKLSGGNGV